MARIGITDIDIGTRGGDVVLAVPIDGRRRSIVIAGSDAVHVANLIATAGVRVVDGPERAGLNSVDVHLKPFGSDGQAKLAFLTVEHGPFVITIDANQLAALAAAAAAALQFAEPGGTA